MKELILSKLFHIGLVLIFGMAFFSMIDKNNTTVLGIVALIGFILMMVGAYRNGFKF